MSRRGRTGPLDDALFEPELPLGTMVWRGAGRSILGPVDRDRWTEVQGARIDWQAVEAKLAGR